MSEFASGEIQLEQAVLQLLVDVITSQRSVCTYTAMQLKVNTCGLRAYCTGVGTSCSIKDIFSLFYPFTNCCSSSWSFLLGSRAKRGAGFDELVLSPLIQRFFNVLIENFISIFFWHSFSINLIFSSYSLTAFSVRKDESGSDKHRCGQLLLEFSSFMYLTKGGNKAENFYFPVYFYYRDFSWIFLKSGNGEIFIFFFWNISIVRILFTSIKIK